MVTMTTLDKECFLPFLTVTFIIYKVFQALGIYLSKYGICILFGLRFKWNTMYIVGVKIWLHTSNYVAVIYFWMCLACHLLWLMWTTILVTPWNVPSQCIPPEIHVDGNFHNYIGLVAPWRKSPQPFSHTWWAWSSE